MTSVACAAARGRARVGVAARGRARRLKASPLPRGRENLVRPSEMPRFPSCVEKIPPWGFGTGRPKGCVPRGVLT
nr:MAG TPA: hypothetical protein [Caudoviricetes sp.]